jgi:hypothetical protein
MEQAQQLGWLAYGEVAAAEAAGLRITPEAPRRNRARPVTRPVALEELGTPEAATKADQHGALDRSTRRWPVARGRFPSEVERTDEGKLLGPLVSLVAPPASGMDIPGCLPGTARRSSGWLTCSASDSAHLTTANWLVIKLRSPEFLLPRQARTPAALPAMASGRALQPAGGIPRPGPCGACR